MSLQRHTFISQLRGGGWHEASSINGGSLSWCVLRQPFLEQPGGRSRQVKRRVGRALKWAAWGLYVAPVLLVLKLGFTVAQSRAADYLMVAFVCLVVVFFGLLNLYVLAAVIAWWLERHGRPRLHLPFTRSGADALALLEMETSEVPGEAEAPAAKGNLLRLTGTVVELTPRVTRDEPVVRDLWMPHTNRPTRITELSAFAVRSPGKQPVVVSSAGVPTLIEAPDRGRLDQGLMAFTEQTRMVFDRWVRSGQTSDDAETLALTLREGDEVELIGEVVKTIDHVEHFDLDGHERSIPSVGATAGASPYRRGSRIGGVIVANKRGQTVVIRRLAQG